MTSPCGRIGWAYYLGETAGVIATAILTDATGSINPFHKSIEIVCKSKKGLHKILALDVIGTTSTISYAIDQPEDVNIGEIILCSTLDCTS